jgi:HD-GYP domain-containing protein (c-di-GMP phosphodiesterase class II)
MIFNSVNQHCLDGIVKLAETHELEAADDILDDRGHKLWAKGSKISADLREKLLRRKLAKPLEATLTVEGAINFTGVVADCKTFLDKNPLFGRILNRDALSLLSDMKSVQLPQSMRLLITSAHASNGRSYQHALGTMLVSAGIAARLGAGEHDAQHLLIAALLHDLGEMYVNPDYLKGAYRLQPHEWKHVASHPKIGQLLIAELTTLPAAIGQCIALHHERLDGSGYPNQIDRTRHQRLGGWLAIADSVGAILSRGDGGAPLRAALALRIVPEEFDQVAVNVVIQSLRKGDDSFGSSSRPDGQGLGLARTTFDRVEQTISIARSIHETATEPFVKQSAATAMQLLNNLEKSLRATGAAELETFGSDALDAEILAEIDTIIREVDWRMRNLARNIHIRAEANTNDICLAALEPLISALDGNKQEKQTLAGA